jgi:hypothetical protein
MIATSATTKLEKKEKKKNPEIQHHLCLLGMTFLPLRRHGFCWLRSNRTFIGTYLHKYALTLMQMVCASF